MEDDRGRLLVALNQQRNTVNKYRSVLARTRAILCVVIVYAVVITALMILPLFSQWFVQLASDVFSAEEVLVACLDIKNIWGIRISVASVSFITLHQTNLDRTNKN